MSKGLGTNRDYKTRDRQVNKDLKNHLKRMNELIKQGKTKAEASKIAYNEIIKGT